MDEGEDANEGDVAASEAGLAGLADSKKSVAHRAVMGELSEAREAAHL